MKYDEGKFSDLYCVFINVIIGDDTDENDSDDDHEEESTSKNKPICKTEEIVKKAGKFIMIYSYYYSI